MQKDVKPVVLCCMSSSGSCGISLAGKPFSWREFSDTETRQRLTGVRAGFNKTRYPLRTYQFKCLGVDVSTVIPLAVDRYWSSICLDARTTTIPFEFEYSRHHRIAIESSPAHSIASAVDCFTNPA
ncbi:hypothetical protein BU23DRAFT_149079 [Bimuria novae-zelandiae CBS 107.79]|uniref:Uncharacterized protein n=1 Tax=Bimuria novae-zelandiae CBS 107.79 TaxID=1447943 RepID=A0A6A5VQU7_9PLEO|nr:hypothetical protein BU23DRAFT_149079 [Bimuria novae-zelandiae CBS 107.79]